jgi:hypothetical protein
MTGSRLVPLVLVLGAMAGIVLFARGLRAVDTVGMFACGALAGGALAALARRR